MEQMMKDFETANRIFELFNELKSAELALGTICTMIDTISAKQGKKSLELVEELKPIIEQVNNELGTMAV